MKAKALKNHSLGYYDKGDIVNVKEKGYIYKVEVRKNNRIVARCNQPKRNFKIIKGGNKNE